MNVRGEAEGVEEKGERQKDTRSARALADTEVEVSSNVVSVASLHPSIEELVRVVQVVLATAAARVTSSGGPVDGKSLRPTVVLSDGLKNRATKLVDSVREILHGGVHVVRDVLAVATRSTSTFVLGDLEHALLSSAAGDRGVARRLLHGDRGNEDGRDAVLLGDLVELVDVGSTGLEGGIALSDDLSEIGVLKLAEGDERRGPSSALETAGEPRLLSVGSAVVGRL